MRIDKLERMRRELRVMKISLIVLSVFTVLLIAGGIAYFIAYPAWESFYFPSDNPAGYYEPSTGRIVVNDNSTGTYKHELCHMDQHKRPNHRYTYWSEVECYARDFMRFDDKLNYTGGGK